MYKHRKEGTRGKERTNKKEKQRELEIRKNMYSSFHDPRGGGRPI